jgi:hypothetical protein
MNGMNLYVEYKYFLEKFKFLKTFNSPFKRPKLKWYFGEVAIGTPYFLPRKWINNPDKPGYEMAIPKKIGFDFVGLGYKTKWSSTDYRFEWQPLISFVFFKWQIAVIIEVPHPDHYWACWLTYENDTDKDLSIEERIKAAKEINPEIWTSSWVDDKNETICYWDKILKTKYI